jgi:hypothetical protein
MIIGKSQRRRTRSHVLVSAEKLNAASAFVISAITDVDVALRAAHGLGTSTQSNLLPPA